MRTPARRPTRGWATWGGLALVLLGLGLLAWALGTAEVLGPALVDVVIGGVGFGPPYLLLKGVLLWAAQAVGDPASGGVLGISPGWLWAGVLAWVGGVVGIGLGAGAAPLRAREPSAAVGAPLNPRLLAYRDFDFFTLLAYGGGILLAELALLVVHTLLAGGVELGTADAPGSGPLQLPPTTAFAIALCVACVIAFAAGYVGSARAGRLAAPEATIGLLYFGTPLPLLLSALTFFPALQVHLGPRLREVQYLAGLLGQGVEASYWLVFLLLVLVLVLGLTIGFVITGSGKADLQLGYELFIARRHVGIFRPRLIIGVLLVLLLGVVPPLLIYAIVRAAGAATEKTRIRRIGLEDPLRAVEAQHEARNRAQTPTEMMTALSVGGVAVGVMALIVVLSVMSGFEADLKKKILGANAHAIVLSYAGELNDPERVMETVAEVPGVTGQTPFVLNEVMLSTRGDISGVLIKGIDPETVGSVSDLPKNVLPGGSIENLAHPERIEGAQEYPPFEAPAGEGLGDDLDGLLDLPEPAAEAILPGIMVGRELAAALRLRVGDRVNVVSPLGGELGPHGPVPKSRPFRVAGVFYTGMYDFDSKYAYIAIDEAQRFFGMKGPNGIELKVSDVDDARRVSEEVLERLEGYPYRTKHWGDMNKNLFSALRLEKLVMGLILSIIVIVAAGLIVATVIMLVLEKRKEISVLKALGVPDAGIVKIFLTEGLQIGVVGGLMGLIAGLAWCFFIQHVGIELNAEVYYIPALPVRIEPVQTALAVVIAILVSYFGSIYPALKAASVEPVEGLKAE